MVTSPVIVQSLRASARSKANVRAVWPGAASSWLRERDARTATPATPRPSSAIGLNMPVILSRRAGAWFAARGGPGRGCVACLVALMNRTSSCNPLRIGSSADRLFRCSGRLFSKIHRKSFDLSDLRPVNRIASLPPQVIAEKQFTANHPIPTARNTGRALVKSRIVRAGRRRMNQD